MKARKRAVYSSADEIEVKVLKQEAEEHRRALSRSEQEVRTLKQEVARLSNEVTDGVRSMRTLQWALNTAAMYFWDAETRLRELQAKNDVRG